MDSENLNSKTFLAELHRQTKGDMQSQVSMYTVGAAIGLAKGEAGSLAEELMVSGLVELRTLAGGISITRDGLSSLGISAPQPAGDNDGEQRLGKGTIADKGDRELLCRLIETVKASLPALAIEYEQLEEIVIDIKTIDVQLLSPAPKIAVFRELLRSLHAAFSRIAHQSLIAKLAPHI